MKRAFGWSVLAVVLAVSSAQAQSIAVPNSSFDTGIGLAGWTTVSTGGGAGTFAPGGVDGWPNPLPAPGNGTTYAFLEASNPGTSTSLTSGNLAAITGDTVYTLTAAIGHRNNALRAPDDYRIELLSNGTAVGNSVLNNAFTNIAPSTFQDLSLMLVVPNGSPLIGTQLSIRLTHSSDSAVFRQGAFDNIRLSSTALPEPASIVIWLMGAVGLVLGGWRVARRRA